MKRLLCLILLLVSCACSAQTIASRRYAEKTPGQYNFGPFINMLGYTTGPNATAVPDAQIQPPSLISDDNTFVSTGNFAVLLQDDAGTTFSVASNQGTIVTGTSSNANYFLGSNASAWSEPAGFVQVEIDQNGTAGVKSVGVGVSDPTAANEIDCAVNGSGGYMQIEAKAGGTFTLVSQVGFTTPAAPWWLGCAFVNNAVATFYKTSSGGPWIGISSNTSSSLDLRAVNLSAYKSALKVYSTASTTWKISNFKTGIYGGVGLRDPLLVTYPDGRPYMQGSVAYLLATVASPAPSFTGNADGIFSYDLASNTLTMLGTLGTVISGSTYANYAGHIVYDPANNLERLLISSWGRNGITSTVQVFYTSQSISTDNWLAASATPHIAPALTLMTFPASSYVYDPYLVCSAWNYSASTCGNWMAAYTTGALGGANEATSTSDPSANTWSSVAGGNISDYEGNRILRTATSSTGTENYILAGGIIASEPRALITYKGGVSQTSPTISLPGGNLNSPHAQMLSYGNTEYFLTFGGNSFNSGGDYTNGNPVVATAPKYAAQTNWPTTAQQYANQISGSAASITSTSLAVTSGDWAMVFCVGTGASSVAASSSLSIGSFTGTGFLNPTGTFYVELFYVKATASGSSTFTCTPNVSSTYQTINVQIIHPGFTSTVDTVPTPNALTGTAWTSNTFSTTAQGFVVACAGLDAAATYAPGLIGPYVPGASYGATAGAYCESSSTTGAQSSITASIGNNASLVSNAWGGAVVSFK